MQICHWSILCQRFQYYSPQILEEQKKKIIIKLFTRNMYLEYSVNPCSLSALLIFGRIFIELSSPNSICWLISEIPFRYQIIFRQIKYIPHRETDRDKNRFAQKQRMTESTKDCYFSLSLQKTKKKTHKKCLFTADYKP